MTLKDIHQRIEVKDLEKAAEVNELEKAAAEEEAGGRIMARGFMDELQKLAAAGK